MPNKLISSKSMAGTDMVYITSDGNLRVRKNDSAYRIHIPKSIIRDRVEYVAVDVDAETLKSIIDAVNLGTKVESETVAPDSIPESIEEILDEDKTEATDEPTDSADARIEAIEDKIDHIFAYLKAFRNHKKTTEL